ncbi:MAG TPA: hemerythrin [Geobacter sp.]|nr:hemerythrin [Geobacter sp.]
MAIEWNPTLSIGVLEIDIQHKILFEKFNAFVGAYESNEDPEEGIRMFWFLEAYAITHFKDEEKLMQQVNFPHYTAHRQKHLAFNDEVGRFKERLKVEGPSQKLFASMASFISGWLIEHISTIDRGIGKFVDETKVML